MQAHVNTMMNKSVALTVRHSLRLILYQTMDIRVVRVTDKDSQRFGGNRLYGI